MTLEFHLRKSFDDPFYIGLNEIQVYDIFGRNVFENLQNNEFKV